MVATTNPIQEKIARRAYEIFIARGKKPGSDLEDWLQAEREVTRSEANAAAAAGENAQARRARQAQAQTK